MTEKPEKFGLSWFHLGKEVRQPFHLYFDINEAMEVLEVVIVIEEMSIAAFENGVPVDSSRFEKLSKVMELLYFCPPSSLI